jgi:hypothetical protein
MLLVQWSMLIMRLLLDLVQVQVGDLSTLSVKDLCELLESWASGLNIEEVHECKFEEDPNLSKCWLISIYIKKTSELTV